MHSGSVFTNNSQEHLLSFSQRFCEFESNSTCDWQNYKVEPIKVVLLSKASEHKKNP